MITRKSEFQSHGSRCAGTLYLPEGIDKPPVVVMGHGLGALKEFRIPAFAKSFVRAGLAAYAFDYRHWGESEGEPRQMISPARQLEDWHAALAHVRQIDEVDGDKLGIWGSSFGGAHVIHVAAEDHNIRAVVAQVLAADTASAVIDMGIGFALRSTALGIVDSLCGLVGKEPLYVPLVGKPGEAAVMNTPESLDGYMAMVDPDTNWENKVAARSLLLLPLYRAVSVGHKVTSPTLLIAGREDSLVKIEDTRKLAEKMPGAELVELDCNHFQPYHSPWFEVLAQQETDFFVKYLNAADN